ncbi:DUF3857 domain-containing transglutaminase family protein [Lysobacter humi (ex Lee et al. 2017)]
MRVWKRAALAALLLAALQVHAEEHVRGAYRFETTSEPDFVVRSDVPAAWPDKAPGVDDARWRYWLYDVQTDHRAGRDRVYVERVFEPRSAAVLNEAGRFEIGFNPDYQKLQIHRLEVRRDGTWTTRLDPARISLARREDDFEQDLANGLVSALIVLQDVRVGDVVRVSYTLEGSNPVLKGQDTDWMYLGYGQPVLDARARMLYDAGTRLAVRQENTAVRPVIRTVAGSVEASVRHARSPAVVYHGDYPVWHHPYPAVQVGPEQAWSDVVDWALPLYPAVTGPLPADLERRIEEWSKLGKPAGLAAALRAVQDDVRYFGLELGESTHRPHPPSETWSRRFGDCKDKAYLLVTVLARLGIDAVPALVSSGDGRAVAARLPAADAFDHVIVRAMLDGKAVWVDPTRTQQGGDPRRVDLSALGVGLPIAAGVTALVPIERPADRDDGVESRETYRIERADTPVQFTVETTYRGSAADHARRTVGSERNEDLARRYAEYYGKRYGALEHVGSPVVDDDRTANILRVRESYRLATALEAAGNVRSLDVYADALGAPAQLPKTIRHPGPLRLPNAPGKYRHVIEVIAPADWSPAFGKERISHESPAFAFSRAIDIDGSTTRVTYEFDQGTDEIVGDGVAGHLGEMRSVRDRLQASLRYQLPAAVQAEERERRLRALLRDSLDAGATK